MIALIVILLVIWAVLAILGFAIKGLLWLAILGLVFFVITLIVGFIRRTRQPRLTRPPNAKAAACSRARRRFPHVRRSPQFRRCGWTSRPTRTNLESWLTLRIPPATTSMLYRRTGRSGLDLPALSLGLWHNFGDDRPFETQRAIVRRAFDLGITHFDLANNYGPPYGSAEVNFGRILQEDLRPYRDEIVVSTKAGWDMWPGPYGQGGGSRKYVLASLDQSLARLGLDYVDIFYSHRPDPSTPLEETMQALDTAVRSGKALYVGISSYGAGGDPSRGRDPARARYAAAHPPAVVLDAQPLDRERRACSTPPDELGVGVIGFTALAQGMLTDKYLDGIPEGSRAARATRSTPTG